VKTVPKSAFHVFITAAGFSLAGCYAGAGVSGSFDKSFTVTGHTRLELTNPSGDVEVTGSADGQVHVHGDVRASGMGFDKPQERLNETVANPGIEQRGDTIRVGKHFSSMRNLAIAYKIEVPHDTEMNLSVVSGELNIRNVRGPITIQGASGSIHVEKIERDAQLTSVSGSVDASDVGGDVRASSASGELSITNAKGDVRAHTLSGAVKVVNPSGRVDTDDASGSIDIEGAKYDAKIHDVSGEIIIRGDPGEHGYWDLKTVSGSVNVYVPSTSNFRFAADAISGEIRADIPIVIEEQGKHSLRAHVGNGGGRVEVHTVSGEIHVSGAH
jgi:DUF4097 and DUF4098 domain-containing protein YvlB